MPQQQPAPVGETVWTVVVAGGSGQRFGGPKQYEMLGAQRVLDWSVSVAWAAGQGVVVVLPAADAAREGAVAGGSSRSESVRNGQAAGPTEATSVGGHDGGRAWAWGELDHRGEGAGGRTVGQA